MKTDVARIADAAIGANEFQCSRCQGVFEKAWTDEEADAEAKDLWPSFKKEEMSVICDDCFNQFMEWRKKHGN